MIQSGKYGEYLVMLELLKLDFEAYLANVKNQENWDITVILDSNKVKRIQVKTTELQNNSKNNSIKNIDKNYDYIIIVVIDNEDISFFIMSKKEALELKGKNIQLSVSKKIRNKDLYEVKEEFKTHISKWDKLKES